MTSNHVLLILGFKMKFRMTLRMSFQTWDFRRVVSKENFEGRGTPEGTSHRTWKGVVLWLWSAQIYVDTTK